MRGFDWAALVSIVWAGIYLLLVFSTRRQEMINRLTQSLMVYAMLSAVWQALWAVYRWGLFDFVAADLGRWLVSFGAIILALLFLICSILFLQVNSDLWAWGGISAGFGGVIFTLLISLIPLPESWRRLIFILLVSGWLVVIGLSGSITYTAFHRAQKPRYKNRVGYWGLSLGLLILGDLFLFSGVIRAFSISLVESFPASTWIIGSTLHLVGVLIAGYVVLIHEPIDLVWGFLRFLSYVSVTIIGVFFFALIMSVDLTGFAFLQNKTSEWVFKSLLSVVLVVPGLSWLYGYANQFLLGRRVDRTTAVREYGLSIGNLVDLERLAEVALDFLDKTFNLEFSSLFVVEDLPEENCYQLLPATNPLKPKRESWQPGRIWRDHIIVRHFLKERTLLTQYDLDFLPKFKGDSPEKAWFSNLQAELFVPIMTPDAWIGLFVLGSKKPGDPFFKDDKDLLSTLANQTVAALQNARLFSDLRRLNEDLRRTYQALEEANQKLRDLDEMKSAFISVVTHEMRTPLANISFSLQVLEMSGTQNLLPEQREQLQQIASGIKTSRSMIDNLITLAALLNDQLELNLEKFDFQEILDWVMPPFVQRAEEKKISLKVDKVGDTAVVGDRKLLNTAVSHLIDNAIKFTGQDGSVWVSCWTTADALWLDVRDTGKGIAPEKLDKVWQSFTQLQADAVRRGMEGLGLGLSLVKLIVTAHGGQVFVESEVGSGSVFGFRIPLKGPEYPLEALWIEPPRKDIPGIPG